MNHYLLIIYKIMSFPKFDQAIYLKPQHKNQNEQTCE